MANNNICHCHLVALFDILRIRLNLSVINPHILLVSRLTDPCAIAGHRRSLVHVCLHGHYAHPTQEHLAIFLVFSPQGTFIGKGYALTYIRYLSIHPSSILNRWLLKREIKKQSFAVSQHILLVNLVDESVLQMTLFAIFHCGTRHLSTIEHARCFAHA